MQNEAPTLITVEELGHRLSLSRATIYRLVDQGLPAVKVGSAVRFRPDEVDQWMKAWKPSVSFDAAAIRRRHRGEPKAVVRAIVAHERAKVVLADMRDRYLEGCDVSGGELTDAEQAVVTAELDIEAARRAVAAEEEAHKAPLIAAQRARARRSAEANRAAEERGRRNAIESGAAENTLRDLARNGSPDAQRQLDELLAERGGASDHLLIPGTG